MTLSPVYEFKADLEDLLQLVQEQHEALTLALRQSFCEKDSTPSKSPPVSTLHSIQFGLDVRTLQPEPLESEDQPPTCTLELAESPNWKSYAQSETCFSGSEGECGTPGQLDKVLNPSRSQLVDPAIQLKGWARLRELLRQRIDYFAGVLVLINSLFMVFELEIEGLYSGATLGLSTDVGFKSMEPTFRVIDSLFDS
eukprot:g9361.t1